MAQVRKDTSFPLRYEVIAFKRKELESAIETMELEGILI